MKTATASNLYFARKPLDLNEMREQISHEKKNGEAETATIKWQKELSSQEYDAFTNNMLADYGWMAGLGGHANNKRNVIAVSAPKRATLFVDPSGSNYARYVGMA
ncbi:hypothetical protein ACFQNF_19625 [Iodobacter arcticus]|uniref:Uncharacterized protein n=1 Tax=Iodobacter arcticus TaxID=590593 RepID=A0ABW2R2D2_9NEIS